LSTTKLLENTCADGVGWQNAIDDAENKAVNSGKDAVRFRAITAVLKRKRDAGEPWPEVGKRL
jgi:hypothetical protein